MRDDYFKKIVKEIEKKGGCGTKKHDVPVFSTLKILEYWIRILNESPNCLNKDVAIRLMDEKHTEAFADEVMKLFKSSIDSKKEDASNCWNPHFANKIKICLRERKTGISKSSINELIHEVINSDESDLAPQCYRELMRIVEKHFRKYAIAALKAGVSKDDVSYKRMLNVKETFRLDDDETELLLHLWLRNSRDLEVNDSSDRDMFRPRRFRDNDANSNSLQNISRATGFSIERITQLLGANSSLTKLQLVDQDMELPSDIRLYLSGYSESASLKAFQKAPEPSVPFEQLQGKNPDARLALDMLRHHDFKHSLNILFYGVEGTGKTELAKAIAKEAGLPLWEVAIDMEDEDFRGNRMPPRRFDGRNVSVIQYRLRAINLANWQCEQERGIILVDEADLVLNGAEKGALNHLFESINTPVIWISNSMMFVEKSTRRRFDFSMAFKRLAKDERVSVLNSVLKAQGAEDMLDEDEKLRLMVEYPAMAGGLSLAVSRTKDLLAQGAIDSPYKTMARILKAHTSLLDIANGSMRDVECHAPRYSLEGLNIEGSTDEIMEVATNYDAVWRTLNEDSAPNSLNMLLYGPPGTGKTEFVRHLARSLGRNLVIKRASDLLGMFVGQTEANIAEAFREAERTQSILFFDEADSFLGSRENATHGHEVSKTNELLTQMENFKGIFVAATNFEERLDPACRRRFAMKLGFSYLKKDGIGHIWNAFFPDIACPDSTKALPMLTPGDFNAVCGRLRYLPATSRTPERIEAELRKEIALKDHRAGRTMGF